MINGTGERVGRLENVLTRWSCHPGSNRLVLSCSRSANSTESGHSHGPAVPVHRRNGPIRPEESLLQILQFTKTRDRSSVANGHLERVEHLLAGLVTDGQYDIDGLFAEVRGYLPRQYTVFRYRHAVGSRVDLILHPSFARLDAQRIGELLAKFGLYGRLRCDEQIDNFRLLELFVQIESAKDQPVVFAGDGDEKLGVRHEVDSLVVVHPVAHVSAVCQIFSGDTFDVTKCYEWSEVSGDQNGHVPGHRHVVGDGAR